MTDKKLGLFVCQIQKNVKCQNEEFKIYKKIYKKYIKKYIKKEENIYFFQKEFEVLKRQMEQLGFILLF